MFQRAPNLTTPEDTRVREAPCDSERRSRSATDDFDLRCGKSNLNSGQEASSATVTAQQYHQAELKAGGTRDKNVNRIKLEREKIKPLVIAFLATLRISSSHVQSNSLAQLTSFIRWILFACYCTIALTLLLIFILGLNHIVLMAVQQQRFSSQNHQQQGVSAEHQPTQMSHARPQESFRNTSQTGARVNSYAQMLLLQHQQSASANSDQQSTTRVKRFADSDLALINQRQLDGVESGDDDESLLSMESIEEASSTSPAGHQMNQQNGRAVSRPIDWHKQHRARHHHKPSDETITPTTFGNKPTGSRSSTKCVDQPSTSSRQRHLTRTRFDDTAGTRNRHNEHATVSDEDGPRDESAAPLSASRMTLRKNNRDQKQLREQQERGEKPRLSFREFQPSSSSTVDSNSQTASETQWIPIRTPKQEHHHNQNDSRVPAASQQQRHQSDAPIHSNPLRHTGQPASSLRVSAPRGGGRGDRDRPRPVQLPPPPPPHRHHRHHRGRPLVTVRHRPPAADLHQANSIHYHHYYHQPGHHWHRNPRFHRPSKMYKRVLLCDKTLVSLDYMRNMPSEPGPHTGALSGLELNEISDNFLDLEGNFDSGNALIDRSDREMEVVVSLASSPARSTTSSLANSTSSPLPDSSSSPASSSTGNLETSESHINTIDRAYLLSDEDPLVRCDMWDLEKGLKSRKPPKHILRMAVKADFDTVRDAINRCRQLSERTFPQEDEYRDLDLLSTDDLISLFSMKRGLIPGTKWCGLGDQAHSYNDLGSKHRIDICCRAHDHCPIRSKPFRNDYGVLNIGLYTKSHCDCDADFYRCLREAHSKTADMLGNLYFNVMKLQCMREERVKVCREFKTFALGFERCIRYEDSPFQTVFKFTTPPVAY